MLAFGCAQITGAIKAGGVCTHSAVSVARLASASCCRCCSLVVRRLLSCSSVTSRVTSARVQRLRHRYPPPPAPVATLQFLHGALVLLNAELKLPTGFLQVSLELLVFPLQLPNRLRTLFPTPWWLLPLGQRVWGNTGGTHSTLSGQPQSYRHQRMRIRIILCTLESSSS